MKKLIAAAGLGAALAVGSLAVAGTASADSGTFVNQLNAHALARQASPRSGDTRGLRRHLAHSSTRATRSTSVQRYVYYNTDYSIGWGDADQFVALADDYLC